MTYKQLPLPGFQEPIDKGEMDYVNSNWELLQEMYADQWIAVENNRILYHARSVHELAALFQAGDDPLVLFVDKYRPPVTGLTFADILTSLANELQTYWREWLILWELALIIILVVD